MFLLFVGVVALAIWIARLVTRMNHLEIRLEHMERNLERVAVKPPTHIAPFAAASGSSSPVVPGPVTAPAPAVSARVVSTAVISEPVVRREPPPAPLFEPALAAADADSSAAWEVVVGGNWLNKIGVFVFVIGIALLVGYSMAHVGPAGRIGIGFAVSLTLLVSGVLMERRAETRTYAYGLIAGGWAGTYFTTYAMRAVDAARVLDNDLVAISLLVSVAAGMVWHSLRYRSQVVTTLAYIVAYATLALTPLRGFALVASVPLALSLVIVAQRFAWPASQILAIVCTYGLYILRGQTFGFGDLDLNTLVPYAALAVYWIAFEAADLIALRGRQDHRLPAPIFLLNAAGLVGAALLQLPMDTPVPLTTFLLLSGVAYLGSAVARARLLRGGAADGEAITEAMYGSYQGASAIAAMLVAWAFEWRFSGSRQTVALLVEAEMVFLSGLILRDWLIRGVGSAVALLVSVHAILAVAAIDPSTLMWSWTAQGAVGAAGLTAAVWYANRELLRSRGIVPLPHEWVFTPVATYLAILVARADLPDGYSAVAIFLYALVLLEAGLRLGREYRYQAYVAGASTAVVLLGWFASHWFFSQIPTIRDAWWILGSAAVAAYAAAWRLVPRRHLTGDDRSERVIGAAIAETLGAAFVVVLQWMVIDPAYVGLAWAGTAAVIGVLGLWWKLSGLRWQAYPLLILALLRVMRPILDPVAASSTELVSAVVVIGVLYAGSIAVRGAIAHTAKTMADVEDAVRIGLSVVATLALGAVIYEEGRPTLVTVSWGLQGVALLATGFPARERLLRLSGLAVLAACIVRLFVFDLPQLEALARIISFVALGLALLAVSWTYTRYRDRIQKYL